MKLKYVIIVLIALLSCSSCNDWLDVVPQGQVQGEDLLMDEKGYNSALDGIYYKLTSKTLYGMELSFGMMDVLAQYWDLSTKTKNPYYKQSLFDYEDATSKTRFKAIWSMMYQGVTQANYILESLEGNRDKIKYSELIEGETYALRAFIHMELASMYGPVIHSEADLDKKCIAYRTEYNVKAQEFESMRSVLTKAKEDLIKAAELLKNDPIVENKRYGNGNSSMLDYHAVLERRGDRMNLYAVKGLLMRVELALMNKAEARQWAVNLIDECKSTELFILTDKTDKLYDINMGEEMLLGFYKNDLWEVARDTFGMDKGSAESNLCKKTKKNNIYLNELYGRAPDGAGTDNRLRVWFQRPSSGADYYNFQKLYETPHPGTIYLPYYPEVAILKLSEVYYVACETSIGLDNEKALEYLNEVRDSRNLAKLAGPYGNEELLEYLMREMRKDFIGEGRMWPIYKRLYRDFYVRQGVIIAPTEDKYVFPIPDEEYEYSPNTNPKGDK